MTRGNLQRSGVPHVGPRTNSITLLSMCLRTSGVEESLSIRLPWIFHGPFADMVTGMAYMRWKAHAEVVGSRVTNRGQMNQEARV